MNQRSTPCHPKLVLTNRLNGNQRGLQNADSFETVPYVKFYGQRIYFSCYNGYSRFYAILPFIFYLDFAKIQHRNRRVV